jgi:hypothetical protein
VRKPQTLQPHVCVNRKPCRRGVRGRKRRNNHTTTTTTTTTTNKISANKGWGHGAGGHEMGSCSSARDAGRRERLAARSAPSSVLCGADSATGARGPRAEAPHETPLNEREAPHKENEGPRNGIKQSPLHEVEAPHNNNNGIKSDVLIRPLRQQPARYM